MSLFKMANHVVKESSPPSPSATKISSAVLLIIVILAAVFFVSGLLHLLIRFFIKRPLFSSISISNRFGESSSSQTFQRQLQHLFRLHDSGLDQEIIDSLPVFHYKEINGLKEPFDCAVCLCEFSIRDKLRLLPSCSHAFHINCIDTWLLSNSTCPLCRDILNTSTFSTDNPLFDSNDASERNGLSCDVENVSLCTESEKICENLVVSVRLGKFKNLNQEAEKREGETSSCNLDARRCFSMGSFQYIVDDLELQVALSSDISGEDFKISNIRKDRNEDAEGKKISRRNKGESLSVSKVWLWSKKGKLHDVQSHLPQFTNNVG